MDGRFSPARRRVLIGLAGIAPAALFLRPAPVWAAAADETFLRVSRIITGADSLSADVGQRIRKLLIDRTDQFAPRLKALSDAMQKTGGSRNEMLAGLSDEQVDFALAIARPWYLGYVGTPSSTTLDDDAEFATFLEAQSYQKIIDKVPRPTYPQQAAGWWKSAPPGVDAPEMPEQITRWTFRPDGPSRILPPDPRWRAYATADHASIEDARRARPGSEDASDSERP